MRGSGIPQGAGGGAVLRVALEFPAGPRFCIGDVLCREVRVWLSGASGPVAQPRVCLARARSALTPTGCSEGGCRPAPAVSLRFTDGPGALRLPLEIFRTGHTRAAPAGGRDAPDGLRKSPQPQLCCRCESHGADFVCRCTRP